MTKYENTEHNVNMLVDRQEEPGGMEDYYYSEVYSILDIPKKTFWDNIDYINSVIEENIHNGLDEEATKIEIERKLK